MNDFEYMPLEFIDEEMVACAMFRSVNMRYIDRRGDCEDWFYSVHRRKPEVLTQDLYILGARCFAAKRDGRIKFLEITPKEYQTEEFYYALCLGNGTQVMEDIPESVLTTNFLVSLLNDDVANIQCFSESALEKEAKMTGRGTVKFWQAAVIIDGRQIRNLHLNDERIKFFLSMYDKDSSEYEYSFKEHYKSYIRGKNSSTKNRTNELAVMLTVADVLSGMDSDSAIELNTDMMNAAAGRQSMLPIHYANGVPKEYSKKYDKEEYLIEIYKKIGIQVLQEVDYDYYNVILPKNLSIVQDKYGYSVKNSNGETLLHYYDIGPFYDKKVSVDEVYVQLK